MVEIPNLATTSGSIRTSVNTKYMSNLIKQVLHKCTNFPFNKEDAVEIVVLLASDTITPAMNTIISEILEALMIQVASLAWYSLDTISSSLTEIIKELGELYQKSNPDIGSRKRASPSHAAQ